MSLDMLFIPSSEESSSSSTSPSLNKRQPLLHHSQTESSAACSGRFAEVAGGTTAECAVICCCCPCGLVNLLYLTIYKLPAVICRKLWKRKRRQKLIKKGLLPQQSRRCKCGCDGTEIQIHLDDDDNDQRLAETKPEGMVEDQRMERFEKEMMEIFQGTGFWRSNSQREEVKRSSSSSSRQRDNQTQTHTQTPKKRL